MKKRKELCSLKMLDTFLRRLFIFNLKKEGDHKNEKSSDIGKGRPKTAEVEH